MLKSIFYHSIIKYIVIMLLFSVNASAQEFNQTFDKTNITIERQNATEISLQIELALSPEQQQQGLMFRKFMAEKSGMLFVNTTPRVMNMWMRNTVFA